jgi:ABC-type antimicrobial peptide transport system permease subunit
LAKEKLVLGGDDTSTRF